MKIGSFRFIREDIQFNLDSRKQPKFSGSQIFLSLYVCYIVLLLFMRSIFVSRLTCLVIFIKKISILFET